MNSTTSLAFLSLVIQFSLFSITSQSCHSCICLLAAVYTWAGEPGCAVPALDPLHRDVSWYATCQFRLLSAAVLLLAETSFGAGP